MACVYECISIVMGLLSVVAERVGCDGMERESVLKGRLHVKFW